MYLDAHIAADRLERITCRAQASVAEGIARATAKVAAKLSDPIESVIAPAELQPESRPGERRNAARFASGSQIHARRIPGTNFEVALDNVSMGGCRIEMIEECEEGEDVIARFPDLEPLGARVRWTMGPSAGLQFVRPIHPAVFGSLLERMSQPLNA
jgi:hypothetical protein